MGLITTTCVMLPAQGPGCVVEMCRLWIDNKHTDKLCTAACGHTQLLKALTSETFHRVESLDVWRHYSLYGTCQAFPAEDAHNDAFAMVWVG